MGGRVDKHRLTTRNVERQHDGPEGQSQHQSQQRLVKQPPSPYPPHHQRINGVAEQQGTHVPGHRIDAVMDIVHRGPRVQQQCIERHRSPVDGRDVQRAGNDDQHGQTEPVQGVQAQGMPQHKPAVSATVQTFERMPLGQQKGAGEEEKRHTRDGDVINPRHITVEQHHGYRHESTPRVNGLDHQMSDFCH